MRFATIGIFAAAIGGATPALASPTIYTERSSFEAANPDTVFGAFGDIAVASDHAAAGSVTFSATCSETGACLSQYDSRLFADWDAIVRRCANTIPDTTNVVFETCLYDHDLGQETPDASPASTLDVSGSGSSFGILLASAAETNVDYVVNGVGGSITVPRGMTRSPIFIGFSDSAPISVSFASVGPLEVYGYAAPLPAAAAVPEPSSWALMIVGFGFAGTALRWSGGARRPKRA